MDASHEMNRLIDLLGRFGKVCPGAFVGIDNQGITMSGKAVTGGYSDVALRITADSPQSEKEEANSLVRVSVDLAGFTSDAVSQACAWCRPPLANLEEGCCAFTEVYIEWQMSERDIAESVADACLMLDALAVLAFAYNRHERDEEYEKFNIDEYLALHGITGEDRERLSQAFYKEEEGCFDHVMAAYSLPYNLDVLSDAGLLDAVLDETASSGLGLYDFTFFGRWFHGSEVISAFRAKGYSDAQIAYISCHDDEIGPNPSDPSLQRSVCKTIERSDFDPSDEFAWAEYLASETGPLSGYL